MNTKAVPHKFIVWGAGPIRDNLIREGKSTERAEDIAHHFLGKYTHKTKELDMELSWKHHGWSVEIEVPGTIDQAEAEVHQRTRHDGKVYGWVRVGFDPESGMEMVFDDEQRIWP
jgi:hypothetical protein